MRFLVMMVAFIIGFNIGVKDVKKTFPTADCCEIGYIVDVAAEKSPA